MQAKGAELLLAKRLDEAILEHEDEIQSIQEAYQDLLEKTAGPKMDSHVIRTRVSQATHLDVDVCAALEYRLQNPRHAVKTAEIQILCAVLSDPIYRFYKQACSRKDIMRYQS